MKLPEMLLLGGIGYLLYKSMKVSADSGAVGSGVVEALNTQYPIYSEVTPTTATAEEQISVKKLRDDQPKMATDTGIALVSAPIQIIEDGEKKLRPYNVVTFSSSSPRAAGTALSGGGTSSGQAISATPTTYTTLSTGAAALYKKYGLI